MSQPADKLARFCYAEYTPMNIRDVPLGFLPTFEAAGRLGSFAAAAAELHLTPSAISQQIRALEESVGVALFERTGRTALLTAAGQRYLCEVQQTLGELGAATSRLQRRNTSTQLRLNTVALAAHQFLLPRMAAFQQRFPELALRVESCNQLIDFKTRDCDAAIRFGDGWPDLEELRLGKLELAPVCSPALAAHIHDISDLTRFCLLDPDGRAQQLLQLYQAQYGAPQLSAARVWSFETCFEALCAAEHGVGVAFGFFPLVTPWVHSGRLAVPLALRAPLPGVVSFVHPSAHAERFPFAAIGRWLADEFAALSPLPPGRIVPADNDQSRLRDA